FSPKEVIARINAILRRTAKDTTTSSIDIGELFIYPEKHEAFIRDETIILTKKKYELLLYLAKNKGKVLSREKLLKAEWDCDFVGDTHIVHVHIGRIREKIEPFVKESIYIKTV